jgi:chromosome partitioning protein
VVTKVWVMANLKGGAGKTTTAVHLAVAAMLRGLRVAISDTDTKNNQQSATEWSAIRGSNEPLVVPMDVIDLRDAVGKAQEAGLDLLVVDTAPNAGPDARDAIGCADLVIIPVKPSWFDLTAVRHTVEIVREVGKKAVIVMTEVDGRQKNNNSMVRDALLMTGIPVAETTIKDRVAYKNAIPRGLAVQEFEPRGDAAADINALLEELLR